MFINIVYVRGYCYIVNGVYRYLRDFRERDSLGRS